MGSFENSTYTDKQKWKLNRRKQKQQDRLRVMSYVDSLKKPCLFCGSPDDIVFHHFNPLDKTRSVTALTTKIMVDREVVKCWCLCNECHIKLHQLLVAPLPCCYDM